MRHGRALRARRLRARAAASSQSQPTMPRLGVPGTVTPGQLERLKALEFETSPHWSREEADLILDTVAYLRAVLAARGEADPAVDLQNRLLVFILSDTALREHVMAWGRERRERAIDVPVARDTHFERVAAEARLAGAPAR